MVLLGSMVAWLARQAGPGGLAGVARGAWPRRVPSDAEVRELLERQLRLGAPDDARVEVEVVGGAVTVRGEVATRADAAAIIDLLGGVAGVHEVQGLLHLPPAVPSRPAHVIEVDAAGRHR